MKLLTIVGTRPEAVKMAPVLLALHERAEITSRLCVTGQHRRLLDQMLSFFGLTADADFALMESGQSLNALLARALAGLDRLLAEERPDRIIVQGDTTTALAGAMAAVQRNIPVAHVEAGLRTFDPATPWPEEANRRIIDSVADQLFAPTSVAAANLRREAVHGNVLITGNTGVDATRHVLDRLARDKRLRQTSDSALPPFPDDRPLVLVTVHRRESFGPPLEQICMVLAEVAERGTARIALPVHPNPEVRDVVHSMLRSCRGVTLLDPLPLPAMIRLMDRADLILTDSGGVQEEAATLGKPALVLRARSDRPESVTAGLARLAETPDRLLEAIEAELERIKTHPVRAVPANPFGDGRAAERVVAGLLGETVVEFGDVATSPAAVPIRRVG